MTPQAAVTVRAGEELTVTAPSAMPGNSAPLLTGNEHSAVAACADAWAAICLIVGTGQTRSADLAEVVAHIHGLQQFILAQAAARAYPSLYRLAGETLGDAGPDAS